MANPTFSENEVLMFWKIAKDARRARKTQDVRFAKEELEIMAMYTTNSALRERCMAMVKTDQVAA